MASRAEKVLKEQKSYISGLRPQVAAKNYVLAGLKDLGLTASEKADLQKKLIPIVEKRITNDRSRTVGRVQGVVNREAKARVQKAKNKI